MNIFLESNPSLSAIAALWALRRYSEAARIAAIKTHTFSWKGNDFKKGDIFIGKLFQYDTRKNHFQELGTCYQGLTDILESLAPKDERRIYLPLAQFLDAELPHVDPARQLFQHAPKDVATIGHLTNIFSVFESLKLVYTKNCRDLLSCVAPILEGYPLLLKKQSALERDLKKIVFTPCGRIAHSEHSQLHAVHNLVFERRSPCVIIFEYHNFIGIIAHPNESLPLNHLCLVKLIKEVHEEKDWILSPCGRVLSYGTPEHHPIKKSKITSGYLAEKLSPLLARAHA